MWVVSLNYRKSLMEQTGEESDREIMEEFSIMFGPFEDGSSAVSWAKEYRDKPGLVGYDVWFVNKL